MDDERTDQPPPAVRATGSPDEDDPHGRLDPATDPAARNASPSADQVPDASEDSFPASDPPTFTRSASTPFDRPAEDDGTRRRPDDRQSGR